MYFAFSRKTQRGQMDLWPSKSYQRLQETDFELISLPNIKVSILSMLLSIIFFKK